MNYVQIMGGLGNQLFQYTFSKYLENTASFPITLYTGFYDMDTEGTCISARNFFLDMFNIHCSKTNDGITVNKVITEENFNQDTLSDNSFFNGYWQNKKYFMTVRDQISSDLRLKDEFITDDMKRISSAMSSCNSIAIHIRRKDYLNRFNKDIFYEISPEYYKDAVRLIIEKSAEDPVIYVFSDDYDYIKTYMANFCNLKTVLMEPRDAHEDLYLMSMAKHHIIANSTFSWWGAALSAHAEGITIIPKHWYKDRKDPDLSLPGWIVMDNQISLDRISVIIPAYNVGKYVGRCLKSIEYQTYDINNLEIILIDDGSTDDTLEQLEAFEDKYPDNVILIKSDENHGMAAARNTGLAYASGKYITFIDSDDFIDASMIYKMSIKMQEYDCDIVECGFLQFTDETSTMVTNDIEDSFFLDMNKSRTEFLSRYDYNKCAVWGRLYQSSFISDNKLNFSEGLRYEDVAFSGLSMFLIDKYYRINETLYYYFYNNDGITRSEYNPEQMRHEAKAVDIMLQGLYERNMLQDILEDHRCELLYAYITSKAYLDPFHKLITGTLDVWYVLEEIRYFKKYLLDLFPDNPSHWKLDDQNELSRLAYHLLISDTSGTELLFRDTDHTSDNTIIMYLSCDPDMASVHSLMELIAGSMIDETCTIDIDKDTVAAEHLLFKHAIKHNDIIIICVGKSHDKQSHLRSYRQAQILLDEYPENTIFVLLQDLYFDQSDECIGQLAELIHHLSDHPHVTLYLYDEASYEIAESIMPSVNILKPLIP